MTEPDTSRGLPLSGMPVLLHTDRDPATLRKPHPITGNYLPARFHATLGSCEVSFLLEAVRTSSDTPDEPNLLNACQVTQLTVQCTGGDYVRGDLPLDLLRQLAVRASTFAAVLLPPNYRYEAHGAVHRTDDDGGWLILGAGDTPAQVMRDLTQDADLLTQVAQLWQQLPHGRKYDGIATAFGFSKSWAHKQVKLARKQLPHLFAPAADQPRVGKRAPARKRAPAGKQAAKRTKTRTRRKGAGK